MRMGSTEPSIDLGPACRTVADLLDGVKDDHLSGPAPCWGDVGGLLDHLMGLTLAFTWAARKDWPADASGDDVPDPAITNLDPRWRTVLLERLETLAQVWRDPAAFEGMTKAGGVDLPGAVTAAVALDEVVLHGWDLARGTGQPYEVDPASTAVVLDFVTQAADLPNKIFGPPVPTPADAPAFVRALGLAGRDPSWTPPTHR
jgi:uncharacterized protein (TIGR03086 family)